MTHEPAPPGYYFWEMFLAQRENCGFSWILLVLGKPSGRSRNVNNTLMFAVSRCTIQLGLWQYCKVSKHRLGYHCDYIKNYLDFAAHATVHSIAGV